MRVYLVAAALLLLAGGAAFVWRSVRGSRVADSEAVAVVPVPAVPRDEPSAYLHCASCHLHDGSGRSDGSIPRLNGQRRAVVREKLMRIRSGVTRLPVMEPFAKTLKPDEIVLVAAYLEALPETPPMLPGLNEEQRSAGSTLYAGHCASCHGPNGEGDDGIRASRLCGQHLGYLQRRLEEAYLGTRGAGDAVMHAVLQQVPSGALGPIVRWLAAGEGCSPR